MLYSYRKNKIKKFPYLCKKQQKCGKHLKNTTTGD